MTNQVTVQFVKGGFVITKSLDGENSMEVVTSVGKLNKAFRAAVEEMSLLSSKADGNDSED